MKDDEIENPPYEKPTFPVRCPEHPRKTISVDDKGYDAIKYPYVGATCDVQTKDDLNPPYHKPTFPMKCPEEPRKTITYPDDDVGHDAIKYPYVGATCDI